MRMLARLRREAPEAPQALETAATDTETAPVADATSAAAEPHNDQDQAQGAAAVGQPAAAAADGTEPAVAEAVEPDSELGGPGARPAGPVGELLDLMDRLGAVLERELELLRRGDLPELQALQADKTQLAAAYEAQVKVLLQDGMALAALSVDGRSALHTAMGRFQAQVTSNERALRAASEVTEGLLRCVVQAVNRQERDRRGYSPSGSQARLSPRTAPAVTVDQRL